MGWQTCAVEMAHAAERGLVRIRRWRGAASGVVCQFRIIGSVHSLLVTRIKSPRTPNKSCLWPGVNGWLGLAQSGALREWVQGVLCPWGLGIGFPIRQTRTTPAPDPHQSTLRRMCHFYNAGLPPQCLVKLQLRDRLRAQVRRLDQAHITPTDSVECTPLRVARPAKRWAQRMCRRARVLPFAWL